MNATCGIEAPGAECFLSRPFQGLKLVADLARGYAKSAPPRATMSRPFRPKAIAQPAENVKTPVPDSGESGHNRAPAATPDPVLKPRL